MVLIYDICTLQDLYAKGSLSHIKTGLEQKLKARVLLSHGKLRWNHF